jgi:DNA-binding HxlR family transcriptional regulator
MSGQRSYEDPCGIARALDAIGERWALLIVRELSYGSKRFTDLRNGLAGASPNVLSQRLRELEALGVIRRAKLGSASYELTDWGRELHPILLQLGRWGARSGARPAGTLSVDALLVALEATFDARAAGELAASYELRLDEQSFHVRVEQGRISIARGTPRDADCRIATDPGTLRALVFGDLELRDARLELRGAQRVGRAFFRLFRRP